MQINDCNFIEELKNKNPDALDYVIDIYGGLIKGITTKVLYSLGNDDVIEECMSDILMAVWTNISKFHEEKGSFKSWIGAVSKFKAIDYYRRHKNQYSSELIDESLTNGISAEDEFIREFEGSGLIKIIEELDEPDRTIFTMKFLLGEKSEKISKVVNLSVSSINTRISRRREKIRKRYYRNIRGGI